MTFKYKDLVEPEKMFRYGDIAVIEPPTPDPNEEKEIGDIVDISDNTGVDLFTVDQIYPPLSNIMKAVPDPKDVTIKVEEIAGEEQVLAAAPEEKEGILQTFLGFKYPPKPPDWKYASLIEKFNYITLPISDFLGRIGGKIATDWRLTTKEKVQTTLAHELADDLKWYQKTPEAIGWTSEKVAEFILLKGIFKASGLHNVLTKAGQKVASPFLAKEITSRGGIKAVSTLSATGLKNLGRKALTSFLTAAPENAAFIGSWSALDAAMKGESPEGIAEEAIRGAGWGLGLTAGLALIAPVTQMPELRLAFSKAMANVGQRFPTLLDRLGKPIAKEVEKEWLKAISKSRGKDVRLIDLTTRERAVFRNAVRAAEKEILKAAEKEAAISAYWASKAVKPPPPIKPPEPVKPTTVQQVADQAETKMAKVGDLGLDNKGIEEVVKQAEAIIPAPEKPVAGRKAAEAIVGPVDTLSEWVRLNREIDGTLKEMQKVSGQARETLRDKLGSLQAERNALDIGHKIRKMTPEEIAEDEEFHAITQDILNAGPDKANAALDVLERRIGLLTKVSEGILTQEEADTLTTKFVAAAKARIPEPQRKQVQSREVAPVTQPEGVEGRLEERIKGFSSDIKIIKSPKYSLHGALFDEALNTITLFSNVTPEMVEHELRHKVLWDLSLKGNFSHELNSAIGLDGRELAESYMRKIEQVEGFVGIHPRILRKEIWAGLLNGFLSDKTFDMKFPEIHKVFSKFISQEIQDKLRDIQLKAQPPTVAKPVAPITPEKAVEVKKPFLEMTREEQVKYVESLRKKPIQELSLADYRDMHAKRFQPGASEYERGYIKNRASIDADYRKAIKAAEKLQAKPEMPKGIAITPRFGAIRDMYNRAHDWMFTFGQAKREAPELYDELMSAYGKRNAGVEKAIDQVDRIMPKEIKLADDVLLAKTYEDKRLSPPENLKELYDNFARLLDEMSKKQLEEGLYAKPFNERMIEENNIRIEKVLAENLKHPESSKRIIRLREENAILEQMRYLPHSIVAKRTIESKLNTLTGDKRKAYLTRLSAFYKKRTGKLFLKDYLKAKLITKEDMRMSRLATEEIADYYVRSAYKGLFDYAKAEGYIKPISEELRKEGWLNQQELGISSPELKDKLVHPVLASALAEMKAMRKGRGSFISQLFGMVKQGQFIKPTIIYTYNTIQKYMRGIYSLNPVTEAKVLVKAARTVLDKDELYHKLNESNLYQFPYEITRAGRDEEISKFINQHAAEVDKLTKLLEKTTDTRWLDPDVTVGQVVRNVIMAAHRAVARLTWSGDKIQRTQSYLILRKMGYPHDEAVKVASKSHGGYSLISEKLKKKVSTKLFVYTFRIMMPIEMAKTITDPLIAAKDMLGGKKIPKYEWERMVKAIIGTAFIPFAIDQYMSWRGFEKEGVHLGPLAWKWRKEVEVGGQTREIVVGINYILNMPIKYWQRLTYYNPISKSTRGLQIINNILKWEIHPVYRIFFWDIRENRKSFGSGVTVYDTQASTPVQFGQIAKYIFGQSFRFFGGMMDAVGEGNMTEKERQEQEKIFDAGLNDLDKLLFTALGYKYTRQPIEERRVIMHKYLEKELVSRIFETARKYEGEELEKRKKGLERWARKSENWIENGMK